MAQAARQRATALQREYEVKRREIETTPELAGQARASAAVAPGAHLDVYAPNNLRILMNNATVPVPTQMATGGITDQNFDEKAQKAQVLPQGALVQSLSEGVKNLNAGATYVRLDQLRTLLSSEPIKTAVLRNHPDPPGGAVVIDGTGRITQPQANERFTFWMNLFFERETGVDPEIIANWMEKVYVAVPTLVSARTLTSLPLLLWDKFSVPYSAYQQQMRKENYVAGEIHYEIGKVPHRITTKGEFRARSKTLMLGSKKYFKTMNSDL